MRGHKQKRGPNTWRLYTYVGRDPVTGKPRQVTKTFHGTSREADTALAAFVAGTPFVPLSHVRVATMTVGEMLQRWIAHVEHTLEPNTLRGYRSKIDTIINPALGSIRLSRLTAHELDSFYRSLLVTGGRSGTGLSAQTVRHVHAILHRALEQALRWEWMTRNPAGNATPPPIPQAEPKALSAEIVAKAIDTADRDLSDIALVATITGMRVGELCGLQWADFDTVGRDLRVWRRASHTTDGVIVRAGTKGRRVRAVGLDRDTVAILRWRRWRAVHRARLCAVELDQHSYIFSDAPDGLTALSPSTVSTRWYRHTQRLGVTLRFHDLRHFHASVLGDSNIPIARVSRRLGHSRTSTTQDVYEHVLRVADHDLAATATRKLRG